MAIISSFLCWSNTRTGSAVSGYYTLVISVVCLAFYMLRYIALDEIKDSIELKGIVYAGFVLYSFLIGVSLILLPGVYMDRKFLLLPWIYVLVITVLYETGAIALITTVHLEEDHSLSPWEIVAIVFYCIRLVANCYCFACVVSQYQELSEGRGTYEFLFKPRRRHMARGVPVSDLDEYHPPYGAALPPYSEVNLYKEYCPPNYENLALDGDDRRWDSAQYGLSLIGAVSRSGGGGRSHGLRGLRGAASTSCLAEVHVSTPPPGFGDLEIYGEDRDYDTISYSSQRLHLHQDSDITHQNHIREVESSDVEQHPYPSNHHYEDDHHSNRHNNDCHHNHFNNHHHHRRHHHRHRHHHHHRHHSLPQTHHSQQDYNSASHDNNNTGINNSDNNQIEFIHRHHRNRSAGSKPIATSSPIDFSRRLPDYSHHLSRSPYPSHHATDSDTISARSCPSTPDNASTHESLGKEPITMTESSGSFLSFSQTDFRTPTPKSSPALSVHSCQRINNSGGRSPPAIHKRTYITWI